MKKTFIILFAFLFCINLSLAFNCEKYSDNSNRAIGDVDGNKIIDSEDVKIILELFLTEEYLVCADINKDGLLKEGDLNLLNSKLEENDRGLFEIEDNNLYFFGEVNYSNNLSSNNVSKKSSSSSQIQIVVSSPKEGESYSIDSVLLTVRDDSRKPKNWKYSLNNGENISFDVSKNNFVKCSEGKNSLVIYASDGNVESYKEISFSVKLSNKNSNSSLSEEELEENLIGGIDTLGKLSDSPKEGVSLFKIIIIILLVFVLIFIIFAFFYFSNRKAINFEENLPQ